MNGRRLQQLTGIRPDHANESIRRLERWEVIITRSGQYGKWMSINFDFKNWGENSPESQTNDPRCLLSDADQSTEKDEIVAFQIHTDPESPHKSPSESIKKEPTVAIKADESTEASQATLPSQSPQPPVKPTAPAIEKPAVEKPAVEKPAVEKPEAEKPEAEVFQLHFPDIIPTKLRQLILTNLVSIKLSEKVQRLLDYFAKCLSGGKIRSPIAYFTELKNRWLRGKLYFNDDQQPAASCPSSVAIKANKAQQRKKIEQRHAYHAAVDEIEHIKKLIKIIRDQGHSTFEEALNEINYTQIWEKANECLEKTREAYRAGVASPASG
jgi:hypothetical protein